MQSIRSRIYSEIIKEYNIALKKNSAQMSFITDEFIPLRLLERILKRILPEKLNFNVKKIQSNEIGEYAAAVCTYFKDGYLENYRVVLPATKNRLDINDVPDFMHEITHLLEFALNPQYARVREKLEQKNMQSSVCKIYTDLYYTDKRIPKFEIKRRTKKFLKGLPTEDKLLILKYFKLQLLTEKNAYMADKLYTNRLNYERYRYLYFNDYALQRYRFQEKINLIDKMRYEIISKERKK